MAKRPLPTPEELRQLLRYEPSTGRLFWRESDPRRAGMEAEYFESQGYAAVSVFGRQIRSHRAIWAIVMGYWPKGEIDHIDGNRSNNTISNLRDVSSAENRRNVCLHKTNTSGVCGVSLCKRTRRWRAQVNHMGKIWRLGRFHSIEEASKAVLAKRKELGFSETHGTTRMRYHK